MRRDLKSLVDEFQLKPEFMQGQASVSDYSNGEDSWEPAKDSPTPQAAPKPTASSAEQLIPFDDDDDKTLKQF